MMPSVSILDKQGTSWCVYISKFWQNILNIQFRSDVTKIILPTRDYIECGPQNIQSSRLFWDLKLKWLQNDMEYYTFMGLVN